jgi:hypothetical protein
MILHTVTNFGSNLKVSVKLFLSNFVLHLALLT